MSWGVMWGLIYRSGTRQRLVFVAWLDLVDITDPSSSLAQRPPSTVLKSADTKEYLEYLGEAYSYFLEGDDDAHSALTADFAGAIEAEHARNEERTKEIEATNDAIAQQIQEVLERPNKSRTCRP